MARLIPILLMLSFGAVLAAVHYYPPLDSGPIFIGGIVLFFGSFFLYISAASHKGMAQYSGVLTFLTGGAVILLLLASAVVFVNAALDRQPAKIIGTTVVGKNASSRRKRSTTYYLRVKSWRPGRTEERLDVDESVYLAAPIGLTVRVAVHPGLLGMPWYGLVQPGQ
jgi:hypothetical protein